MREALGVMVQDSKREENKKKISTVQLVTNLKFSVAEQTTVAFVRLFFLMVRKVN